MTNYVVEMEYYNSNGELITKNVFESDNLDEAIEYARLKYYLSNKSKNNKNRFTFYLTAPNGKNIDFRDRNQKFNQDVLPIILAPFMIFGMFFITILFFIWASIIAPILFLPVFLVTQIYEILFKTKK